MIRARRVGASTACDGSDDENIPYHSSHPGYYLTPAQATLLRPFLSRVVLQNLSEDLQRQVPFEGRRLQGAALVVDVSGFTKLEILLNSRGRAGIEEFGERLHAIFDVLVHLVVESGGLVLEFAGDALITFFADEDFVDDGGDPSSVDPTVVISRARGACEQMMASMKAFPNIKLHGGIARGELRCLHLGCATAAMDGESRRGNLFVGSSLNAAVKLLDESEKGEILVEGMASVKEDELPKELAHMADLKWFHPERGDDADTEAKGNADSANGDGFAPGPSETSSRGLKVQRANMRQMMRKPTVLARAAQSKAIEQDRNLQVQSTWKLVEANLEANGVAFFRNVFRLAPAALQLFSFREVPNLYESKELKAHAVRVMSTVGVAVAGLNEVEKLIPILTMLGKKHLTYGVLPAHYDVVGQALLETLELGLSPGGHWTPAAKHAWGTVYGTVAGVMKSAAEKAQKAAAARDAKTNMLGAQVQEAMATTGVHYLQRYVLRHVVANETQDTQRMSELRNIASLFACVPVPLDDITGEIDLKAHNEAFAACHECVESLGGVVNQYLWDDKGVILKAAWGMLRPTRDDKKHAALCALQLVKALGDKCRVGVAAGWAFTGLVGAEGMRLGMVMFGAESVTLAARLMMKANFGSALVSAEVKAATERHIVYEGEGEPDLVLKGRNRDEPVCRPVKVKISGGGGSGSNNNPSAPASDVDSGVMLARPTIQAPLRSAVHAFVQGDTNHSGASVVVVQGGGGCGKSILVDQLAAKVEEESLSGSIPVQRAPQACSITAALHQQTTPYFVWRCFLHWALDEERDLHFLSAKSKQLGVINRTSSKGNMMRHSSSKGNMLRHSSSKDNLMSTRSRVYGDAELTSTSVNAIKKRSMSSRRNAFGEPGDDNSMSKGSRNKLFTNKTRMQGGFMKSADGAESVTLPDDFKIHDIIYDRLRATSNNLSAPMELNVNTTKGALPAEIAAAELLFPSGDPTMDTLLQDLSDEDWDNAHDLIKQIMLFVVAKSKQPMMLILDDAHYCDPTSWNLLEWLSSSAAAMLTGKLIMVVVGLSAPEAPNDHVARINRMQAMGHAQAPIDVGALTEDESKKLIHTSLGVLAEEGETVSPKLESYILGHANGSPRDIVMLVDLLCRENFVTVTSTGQHEFVRRGARESSASSGVGGGGGHSTSQGEMVLPDGVWGALVARIDMLTAAEADLLKCAGILGVKFSVDVLVQIVDHSKPVMLGLLESIEAQGLIRLLEPGVYTFVYPLQAQVAVSLMMTSQQEEMHLLVASVYEMEATDLVPFTAERAMHYTRAGAAHGIDAAKLFAAAAEEADAAGAIALAGTYLKEVISMARSNAGVMDHLPVFLARAAANLMSEAIDQSGDVAKETIEAMRSEAHDYAEEALELLKNVSEEAASSNSGGVVDSPRGPLLLHGITFSKESKAKRERSARDLAKRVLDTLNASMTVAA